MNGIHDMGGMHGFGNVEIEPDEPLFHAEWEARARAIAMLSPFNLDEMRFFIEDVSPAAYLESTYFDRWLNSNIRSWITHGFLTNQDLGERVRNLQNDPEMPMPEWPGRNPSMPVNEKYQPSSAPAKPPRFRLGDRVMVRNDHPAGHTRRPRYVRGKRGIISRLQGPQILPDTNAHGLGQHPEEVYSVTFEASELWGSSAEPNHRVSIDLWDCYLDPLV